MNDICSYICTGIRGKGGVVVYTASYAAPYLLKRHAYHTHLFCIVQCCADRHVPVIWRPTKQRLCEVIMSREYILIDF